ncbi:MAG: hypothetical protein AMJ89_03610 [candidate division Zixibacteria bacterium SM23_73]|nr:MAG: hypothetical protein AMJ89_03610 [candidate division Zixibacteria bacterium SM23_73]
MEFNIPISQTKVCGYKNRNSDTPSKWRGGRGAKSGSNAKNINPPRHVGVCPQKKLFHLDTLSFISPYLAEYYSFSVVKNGFKE